MGMPQETTDEGQPEPAARRANADTRTIVDLAAIECGFTVIEEGLANLKTALRTASIATGSITDLQRTVGGIKSQLVAAAVEANARVPSPKEEISRDAPAIIIRRTIGEAIILGDLKPGQILPGKDIVLVTVWEPVNRAGEKLGKSLASFGAPENLPGDPQTFDQNIVTIANLRNWHGHDGWEFDRQRCGTPSYEDVRFKGYQDSTSLGLWGSPELPLINGNDRDGKQVAPAENMLALSRDDRTAFKNFVTGRSGGAKWSQACTEHRDYPGFVPSVRFPDGRVDWDFKDNGRSCVRPVVALGLNHLIL